MLSIQTTLVLALSIVSLANASAIKGHPRPAEDARSIKLAPQSNNIDKSLKSSPQSQAPAAILESTKKIYNDESIRRLAAAQQQLIVDQAPIAAIKQAEPVVVAQKEAEIVAKDSSIPVAAPVAPVVPPAVPVVAPVVAAPVVAQPVQPVVEQSAPVVVAAREQPVVAAPVVPIVKPVVDELPAQSERSAPIIRNDVPPAPAPVVVQNAPVAEQPVAVVQRVAEQPAIVPPAPVVAQVQPEPVVVPAVVAAPVQPVEPVKESILDAKKDDVPVAVVPAPAEPIHIEVPAPDPQLVLSEPIDSTTKLLIDLDEHVQKFLPAEDKQEPSAHKDHSLVAGIDYSPASSSDPTGKSAPIVPYSAVGSEDSIVPPLPSLDGVEKASAAGGSPAAPGMPSASSQAASAPQAGRQGGQNHHNQQQVISQLLVQLDSLQVRIQDTMNQLTSRRRYVMSALLRPMGTYVRRVRSNLERLQNRVNQLQSAAISGQNNGGNRPGFVDAAAIETIRRRIDDISKRISDIVNRIRFSLTPTSAPLNSNGRK